MRRAAGFSPRGRPNLERRPRSARGVTILLTSVLLSSGVVHAQERHGEVVEEIRIRQGDLDVLFRDNSESPKVLSGVQSLFNVKDAPGFDAYDPDSPGASAGLNFEHIISGHESPYNKFTPRHGRYTLHRVAGDENAVVLVRRAEDGPWKIASTLTYTVAPPHSIDVSFRCTPTDASLFGERGHAIFFFANYMNDVADPALHFRAVERQGGDETWIAGDAPRGPADWNGGGTYRHVDAAGLDYDGDVSFRLNSWSYDWPRFTKPFYYGRAAHDMTLMMMFDRTHSTVDEVRFSLFKFKLDRFPRPAWDFQYVIHKVEPGREYGFNARLVWKKFVSPEDCLAEYTKWSEAIGRDGDKRDKRPSSKPD